MENLKSANAKKTKKIKTSFSSAAVSAIIIAVITIMFIAGEILIYRYTNEFSQNVWVNNIYLIYLPAAYLVLITVYTIYIVLTGRHIRNIENANKKYSDVFGALNIPVILSAKNGENHGVITFFNKAAEREFGDISNIHFNVFMNSFICTDTLGLFNNLLCSANTGSYFKVENKNKTENRAKFKDLSSGNSRGYNTEYNIYVLTDVTEELRLTAENEKRLSDIEELKKQNDAKQKELETTLSLNSEIIDSSDIMSCIIDFDGRIIYASKSFMKTLGIISNGNENVESSENSIISKNILDFTGGITADDIADCKNEKNNMTGTRNISTILNISKISKILKEKEGFLIRQNNPDRINVRIKISALKAMPALCVQFTDITAEKELYEQRLAAENQSERNIALEKDISDTIKMQEALKQEFKIQEFLAELNALGGFYEDYDILLENTMRAIGEFLGLYRVCIFKVLPGENKLRCTHEWIAHNTPLRNKILGRIEQFDLNDKRIRHIFESPYYTSEPHIPCIIKLFESREQDAYRITVPIIMGKKLFGFLSADASILLNEANQTSQANYINPSYMTREKYIKTLRTISVACSNIMEKKIAENTLKETKKTLELIISNVPYSIFWKNTDSIYMGCNNEYLALSGIGEEGIYGKSEYDLNSEDIAEKFIEEDKELLKTRKDVFHRETKIQRNGKDLWVSTSKVLIMNEKGEPFSILGIIEDITERKETEKMVSEASARFEAIIKNYPGGIWCVNNDREFTVLEGLELKHMGLPASSEAIGRQISDVLRNFPQILDRLNNSFDLGPQNWTYTNADGRSYNCSTSFIIGEDGSQVGIIGMANDITESVKIQEQLVEAIERAENASKAKSEFLSRMSHELRTPMNAIIGMTKIALSDKYNNAAASSVHTPKLDKMINSLEKIDTASTQLLGIINDILDMSKIEAQKFELVHELFDFYGMIQRIYNLISVKADEKQITFGLDISSEIAGSYVGDEMRLSQVIINLLSNAVKFTANGGRILLSARIIKSGDNHDNGGENDEHDKKSNKDKKSSISIIEVKVEDNGIGIPKEQQERLFNSFEQANGTIARKYGGTGLGLAISKKIVGLMGGNIGFESESGKGSTFIFTVKLENAGEKYYKSAEFEAKNKNIGSVSNGILTADFSNYSVILAEDVDVNREIVTSLLADTKLNIFCAENGEEAYKMFAVNQGKYDAILMDIQMPVLDGYEATKMIRNIGSEKAKTIPIIAMTANAFQEDINECKNAGMNDHIAKPIDIALLMQKLTHYLPYANAANIKRDESIPAPIPVTAITAENKENEKDKENKKAGEKLGNADKLNKTEQTEQDAENRQNEKAVFSPESLMPDINYEEGLKKVGGNKRLFVSLMKSFKGDDFYNNLVNALENNDIKEGINHACALKNLGINFSMPVVYINSMIVENHLKNMQYTEPEYLEQLKGALDEVKSKIDIITTSYM